MLENNRVIEVALPVPLHNTFHYAAPEQTEVQIGSRVFVEFRRRKIEGYVIGFPEIPYPKIKPILHIINDTPIFSLRMLEFFKWISTYYGTPLGEVIKTALPLKQTSETIEKITPSTHTTPPASPLHLNEYQARALDKLVHALQTKKYESFLLYGITGSGKTEVYLQLIDQALQMNREAIVLVPEISLTPQLLSRFESRFPGKIASLHSRLTPHQRHIEWMKIKNRKTPIVIGARSAIFAPLNNIGVIIVDEEHDTSFKQEERLRYNARDLALVRAHLENAIAVLGSATPALETYYNTKIKKIQCLSLPQRIDHRPLPKVEIINLAEQPFTIFSEPLRQALTENLHAGKQSILLLNRRGYSPFLLCQQCGYVEKCPHCSVSLTVYLSSKNLICHYCSFTIPFPSLCKECQSQKLQPLGLGTEKVESTLKELYPSARIARLDKSSARKKNVLEDILRAFSEQKIDILIGTQMIAKGHDFPHVTLVGVILADVAFNLPDFRASEKTFQLLTQVAGRSGRGSDPGRVFIQTFQPDHYSITFSKQHDYLGFFDTELQIRKELYYPPFTKLVHFKISDENADKALEKIKILAGFCKEIGSQPPFQSLQFCGPSVAPLSKIKNKFRFHYLMKSPGHITTRKFLSELLKHEKLLFSPPVIHIDVDPMNLL